MKTVKWKKYLYAECFGAKEVYYFMEFPFIVKRFHGYLIIRGKSCISRKCCVNVFFKSCWHGISLAFLWLGLRIFKWMKVENCLRLFVRAFMTSLAQHWELISGWLWQSVFVHYDFIWLSGLTRILLVYS